MSNKSNVTHILLVRQTPPLYCTRSIGRVVFGVGMGTVLEIFRVAGAEGRDIYSGDNVFRDC